MSDYIRRLAEPHTFPDGRYTFYAIAAPEGMNVHDANVHETDLINPDARWLDFSQCAECGELDRVMDQVQGLCYRCYRRMPCAVYYTEGDR